MELEYLAWRVRRTLIFSIWVRMAIESKPSLGPTPWAIGCLTWSISRHMLQKNHITWFIRSSASTYSIVYFFLQSEHFKRHSALPSMYTLVTSSFFLSHCFIYIGVWLFKVVSLVFSFASDNFSSHATLICFSFFFFLFFFWKILTHLFALLLPSSFLFLPFFVCFALQTSLFL